MAFRLAQVLLLLQIYEVTSFRSCSDCIKATACTETSNFFSLFENEQSTLKLFQALCGYDGKTPMVCCADFAEFVSRVDIPNSNEKIIKNNTKMNENISFLPQICGRPYDSDRITLGSYAIEPGELPWMAQISTYIAPDLIDFTCGGSIINSEFILTAAHCVFGKKIVGVRVGAYYYYNNTCNLLKSCTGKSQNFRIAEYITHKNYSEYNKFYHNDIALIRLKKKIDFDFENVDAICLPINKINRERNLISLQGTIAGWGLIKTSSKPNELQKVNVIIREDSACERTAINFICAGDDGKDSCNGDSGGPLIVMNKENTFYVQYGIVSRGNSNCGSGPAIYTDVRKYIDWILEELNKYYAAKTRTAP